MFQHLQITILLISYIYRIVESLCMQARPVIRQLNLFWSITLSCSAKVSPTINLQRATGGNSVVLYCRATLLTDRSTCLWVLIDKL